MSNMVSCALICVCIDEPDVVLPAYYDPATERVHIADDRSNQFFLPQSPVRLCIRKNGQHYDVRPNTDGSYSILHTYGVFFRREGYAQIQAATADEAMQIADSELTHDDVSWNEDWHPTNVQLEENE